jgi:hypothetical protein
MSYDWNPACFLAAGAAVVHLEQAVVTGVAGTASS